METKPESVTVDPEITAFKGLRYGAIRLGNNEKDVLFVMGKDDHDYYSELYVDQNFDNHITVDERVPNMDTWESKDGNLLIHGTYTYPKSVPVMVSYKRMDGEELLKRINLYIQIEYITSKNDNDTYWVGFINVNPMTGSMKFTVEPYEKTDSSGHKTMIERRQKESQFWLVDTNSNGCYNDFQKDHILVDLNEDGKIENSEVQVLNDSYVVKAKKQKIKMQFLILPCPGKIAVIQENQDFNREELEPQSDTWDAFDADKKETLKFDKDKF